MSGEKLKYMDVYQTIKSEILSGKYRSGAVMPTEMEMCEIYSVGRSTLRRALAMLAEESFIKAQQGHGTTVSYAPEQYDEIEAPGSRGTTFHLRCLLEGSHTYTNSPMAVDTVLAPPDLAKKMRLPVGSPVYRVQRINYVNGKSYGYMVNYVNPALAPDLDKHEIGPHITEYFVKRYGIKRTKMEGLFGIAQTDFKQSQFLGVPLDTPCMVQTRIGWVNDQVYDYSEHFFNPELIEFAVTFAPRADLDDIVPEEVDRLFEGPLAL